MRPRTDRVWNPSCLIGEVDEEADQALDLTTIRAEPLPPIRY